MSVVNSYKTSSGASGAGTYALGFTPTPGNTLILWVNQTSAVNYITGANLGSGRVFDVHDSVTDNTYGEGMVVMSRVVAAGDASSVTFTQSSAANIQFAALEVSGILTPSTSGYEASAEVFQPGGATAHSSTFTTANPNDFILVGIRYGGSAGTLSGVTSGYTFLSTPAFGSGREVAYNNDIGASGSHTFAWSSGFMDPRIHIYKFKSAVTDPTVTSVTGSTVNEGAANRFTVALSGPTNRSTDFTAIFGGTAVAGTDYDSDLANATFSTGASYVPGVGVRVLSGYSGCTVDVPTVDNALDQDTRQLVLIVGGMESTGGAINDNDGAPSIVVSDATESFGRLTFNANLSVPSGKVVTADFSTANGSKTSGVDYVATSGTIGFNPGEPLTKPISVKVGPTADAPQVLRFASPYNCIPDADPVAAATTYLSVRARIPFVVGSGDLSQIVLALAAWNVYGGTINYLGNAYTFDACAFEKDGATASVPVNFSAGRSRVVADGTAESLSDSFYASLMALANVPRGTKIWMRFQYSVASAGLKLPRGKATLTQWGAGASAYLLTAVNDCSPVDGVGAMTATTGATTFTNPYVPIVLGKFVSGDPKTFIGMGDPILAGVGDTSTGFGQTGAFSLGLTDADHFSNPIGGANFAIGTAGATAALWTGTNSALLTNYLKYAKYAVDEYGTVRVETSLATAQSESQALWALCAAAGIKTVLRPMLIPHSTGVGGTLPYSSKWSSGGDARLFNDWLTTYQLGVAQGVELHALRMQAVRIDSSGHGSPFTADTFYHWLGSTSSTMGTATNDGFLPNTAGYVAQSANYRAAFGVLN